MQHHWSGTLGLECHPRSKDYELTMNDTFLTILKKGSKGLEKVSSLVGGLPHEVDKKEKKWSGWFTLDQQDETPVFQLSIDDAPIVKFTAKSLVGDVLGEELGVNFEDMVSKEWEGGRQEFNPKLGEKISQIMKLKKEEKEKRMKEDEGKQLMAALRVIAADGGLLDYQTKKVLEAHKAMLERLTNNWLDLKKLISDIEKKGEKPSRYLKQAEEGLARYRNNIIDAIDQYKIARPAGKIDK